MLVNSRIEGDGNNVVPTDSDGQEFQSPAPSGGVGRREELPSAPTGRDRGRFTAGYLGSGYLAATGHALTAAALPPELVHVRAEVATFVAGCLGDEGGEPEVPTRRKALLEYRARVHRRIVQLDDAIELKGLLDRHGKLRLGWLSQLSSLITTATRIDSVLGLERRQKHVPSLAEYLLTREDRSTAEASARPRSIENDADVDHGRSRVPNNIDQRDADEHGPEQETE